MDIATPPFLDSFSPHPHGSPFSDYFTDSEQATPDLLKHNIFDTSFADILQHKSHDQADLPEALKSVPNNNAREVSEHLLRSFEQLYKNYSELKMIFDAREIDLKRMVDGMETLQNENKQLKSALTVTSSGALSKAGHFSKVAESTDHLPNRCMSCTRARPKLQGINETLNVEARNLQHIRKTDQKGCTPTARGGVWVIHPNTVKYVPRSQASFSATESSVKCKARKAGQCKGRANAFNLPQHGGEACDAAFQARSGSHIDLDLLPNLQMQSNCHSAEITSASPQDDNVPVPELSNPIAKYTGFFKQRQTSTSSEIVSPLVPSRADRGSMSRSVIVETLKTQIPDDYDNDDSAIASEDEDETVQGDFRPFKTSRSVWGVLWETFEAFASIDNR